MNLINEFKNTKKYPYEVIDKELIASLRMVACENCGGYHFVAGHHKIKQQTIKLDVKELMCSLCQSCHQSGEFSPLQFIRNYGKEAYKRFFLVDEALIARAKFLLNKAICEGRATLRKDREPKKTVKQKIQGSGFATNKGGKYIKKMNGKVELRK